MAVYVDVDGLKAVGDRHGHHAGDDLRQDVVEVLRQDMRAYDLIVRLGGDEFLCIMPGITAGQARRRFEHAESDLPAGPSERSISIGLGELRDGEGPMALVDRADRDLIAGRGAREAQPEHAGESGGALTVRELRLPNGCNRASVAHDRH